MLLCWALWNDKAIQQKQARQSPILTNHPESVFEQVRTLCGVRRKTGTRRGADDFHGAPHMSCMCNPVGTQPDMTILAMPEIDIYFFVALVTPDYPTIGTTSAKPSRMIVP